MNKYFNVGDRIYGFCNGYFGMEDYNTKVCIMVTAKFAVFLLLEGEENGNAVVLNNPENLDEKTVAEWKMEEDRF